MKHVTIDFETHRQEVEKMKERLLVMACSGSKSRTFKSKVPARNLYIGSGWRVLNRWANTHPVQSTNLPVMVVSAEHGFIDSQTLIAPYDRKMTSERVVELIAQSDGSKQELEGLLQTDPEVFMYGSAAYADYFEQLMPSNYVWTASCDGSRGIGDQLHALKKWLGQ